MARVLVVSRNPAMAMGLSATDYDVIDLKPPTFGDWIAGPDAVDALVLDLEAPALAAAAVVNLRAHGKHAPALLVSSDRPGWDAQEMAELVATQILPQPITRVALLAAVEAMLTSQPVDPDDEPFIPEAEPDDGPLRTAEALSELRQDDDSEPADGESEDEIDRLIVDPRPAPDDDPVRVEAEALGAAAKQAQDTPTDEESPAPPAAPRPRRRRAAPQATQRLDDEEHTLSAVPRTRRSPGTNQPTRTASAKVLDDIDKLRTLSPKPDQRRKSGAHAGARRKERPRAKSIPAGSPLPDQTMPNGAAEDPVDLVRRLAVLTDGLYGVPETAQVVIADAVDRVGAGGGALLVPDADAWRVSAGVELRSLEHRFVLPSNSWLVQEVAERQLGVIIEDSDIARERLQGAPLASWRHLLAAPAPEAKALLILARREDSPFTEEDLGQLARLGKEAGALLRAAMDTRDLARRLAGFRDELDVLR